MSLAIKFLRERDWVGTKGSPSAGSGRVFSVNGNEVTVWVRYEVDIWLQEVEGMADITARKTEAARTFIEMEHENGWVPEDGDLELGERAMLFIKGRLGWVKRAAAGS